jgi:hypothetical protein
MNQPKQQIVGARVPYQEYRKFEELCIEHGTNMSRAIGEYLSLCLQHGTLLSLRSLPKDNSCPANEPGGQCEQ